MGCLTYGAGAFFIIVFWDVSQFVNAQNFTQALNRTNTEVLNRLPEERGYYDYNEDIYDDDDDDYYLDEKVNNGSVNSIGRSRQRQTFIIGEG
uniref:Uncharacterized protein n=1 Tax=Glossina palpalis gambiensis TaxID=67801 RepID=A0A1B0B0L2_9MUSC